MRGVGTIVQVARSRWIRASEAFMSSDVRSLSDRMRPLSALKARSLKVVGGQKPEPTNDREQLIEY